MRRNSAGARPPWQGAPGRSPRARSRAAVCGTPRRHFAPKWCGHESAHTHFDRSRPRARRRRKMNRLLYRTGHSLAAARPRPSWPRAPRTRRSPGSAVRVRRPARGGRRGHRAAPLAAATGADSDNGGRVWSSGAVRAVRAPAGSKLALRVYAAGVQIYRGTGARLEPRRPSAGLSADAAGNSTVGIHYSGPTWGGASAAARWSARSSSAAPRTERHPLALLGATSSKGRHLRTRDVHPAGEHGGGKSLPRPGASWAWRRECRTRTEYLSTGGVRAALALGSRLSAVVVSALIGSGPRYRPSPHGNQGGRPAAGDR